MGADFMGLVIQLLLQRSECVTRVTPNTNCTDRKIWRQIDHFRAFKACSM